MASQQSSKQRNTEPAEPRTFLSVSEIHNMEDVEFVTMPKRGSQYQPIVDKMKKLKKGQSFMVETPKDTPVKVIHNRMNAALKRFNVQAPKGCSFVKRTRADGNIEIGCVEV